jgi:hypothetical protein
MSIWMTLFLLTWSLSFQSTKPVTTASKPEQECWKNAKEETNTDRTKRQPPVLPSKFHGVSVRRTFVAVKLCIDSAGLVDRTILVTSSGNSEIDEFYRAEFKTWTFKPLVKAGGSVPSVWTISVNWNPR